MSRSDDGQHEEYEWASARPAHNHEYLAPAMLRALGAADDRSLLDLGCGNGSMTAQFADAGFDVTGTEYSASGIQHATAAFPQVRFVAHDVNEPLPDDLRGRFDVVVSAEVIEHLLLPRELFGRAREALSPGGLIYFSTPFHGYWKNLALAVTNKYDHHWRPSWDYGHVKFFSIATLGAMAEECGFEVQGFDRIGRIPALAKTMILQAQMRG